MKKTEEVERGASSHGFVRKIGFSDFFCGRCNTDRQVIHVFQFGFFTFKIFFCEASSLALYVIVVTGQLRRYEKEDPSEGCQPIDSKQYLQSSLMIIK